MNRLPDDLRIDDPVNGPEFSVRIMSVLARNSIETVGQLRAQLDNLPRWKGLGTRSINEIKSYFEHNDAPESLFQTEEYKHYKMQDVTQTVFALMHDVQNHLVRAALQGRIRSETRNHLRLKLLDAAEKIQALPTYTGD